MYVCIESPKPKLAEICRHIRDEAACRWRDLGLNLAVPVPQLDIIHMNHSHDIQSCCTEMFSYWLQADTEASWRKLIIAFKNMGLNSLANKIKTEILLGTYAYICSY